MNTSWRVSWIPMCMRAYIRVANMMPGVQRLLCDVTVILGSTLTYSNHFVNEL